MAAFKGLEQWLGTLADKAETAQLRANAGTKACAEKALARSNELAPKDTGAMVASGQVVETDKGAEVSYSAPYAVVVHERLDVHHPNGQAKFLERAMQELAPEVAPTVAEHFSGGGS